MYANFTQILALMNLGTRIFALIAATNDSISWGDKSDNGKNVIIIATQIFAYIF